jgi:LemA protein
MTPTHVLIAVAAVLGFWIVGAYNRLVGLRNVIATAWTAVDEHLRRRGEVLASLLSALRDGLRDDPHVLEAAAAAQQQLQAAAETLRGRPLQAAGAASLVAAEGVLASALARVRALLELQPALRDEGAIALILRERDDVDMRLMMARQAFNDAVDAYNGAARQFPTSLVARLFGLRRAGKV